jgi:hypothetical protein
MKKGRANPEADAAQVYGLRNGGPIARSCCRKGYQAVTSHEG